MNLSQHTKEHKSLNDSAMNQVNGSVCSRFVSLLKTDNRFCILAISLVICTISFFAAGFIPEEKEHFSYEKQVEKGKIYEFHAPCEIVVSAGEWADFAEIYEEIYIE